MTTIMWRINKKGEAGIFACTECRPYFGKAFQNTDDVLARVSDIKSKLPRAFGGHNG